jgi:hypothetical protein
MSVLLVHDGVYQQDVQIRVSIPLIATPPGSGHLIFTEGPCRMSKYNLTRANVLNILRMSFQCWKFQITIHLRWLRTINQAEVHPWILPSRCNLLRETAAGQRLASDRWAQIYLLARDLLTIAPSALKATRVRVARVAASRNYRWVSRTVLGSGMTLCRQCTQWLRLDPTDDNKLLATFDKRQILVTTVMFIFT